MSEQHVNKLWTWQNVITIGCACITGYFVWQGNITQKQVAKIVRETSFTVEVSGADLVFRSGTDLLSDVTPVYVTPTFRAPDNTISVGEKVELRAARVETDLSERTITFRNVLSADGLVCFDRPNRARCKSDRMFRLQVEFQQNGLDEKTRIAGPVS